MSRENLTYLVLSLLLIWLGGFKMNLLKWFCVTAIDETVSGQRHFVSNMKAFTPLSKSAKSKNLTLKNINYGISIERNQFLFMKFLLINSTVLPHI